MNTKLAGAALLAVAALSSAPVAVSEPLPNPEPVLPGPGVEGNSGYNATTGETRVSAPTVGGEQSSSTGSFVNPMQEGPNINGIPCEGAFESTVCYGEQMGDSPGAVQPRSEISASP